MRLRSPAAASAWSATPFEHFAAEATLSHDLLLDALRPDRGERWLDVGTGAGGVAVRAACAGAHVTALDLARARLDEARAAAARAGVAIELVLGDAERLPFADAAFDVVASAQGVIFAPDHEAAAAELARVCAPRGRLGLTCLQPSEANETLFAATAEFARDGCAVGPTVTEWGRPSYLRALLESAFELSFESYDVPLVAASAEDVWHLYRTHFPPLKSLVDELPPMYRRPLRERLIRFWSRFERGRRVVVPRPCLLVIGRRRCDNND